MRGFVTVLLLAACVLPGTAGARTPSPPALSFELSGTVNPARAGWLDEALQEARERDAPLVIVPARVNAVAYFRVIESINSVISVENFRLATSEISQTTLRSVLGKADLDTLLAERERLNEDLQRIIDEQTEPWGVKVSVVEIKDVEIPGDMQRAMARQAEAERNRRARVINAEGEFQAAERLQQAATIIGQAPAALQLRYLQTLGDIGSNQNTTVVFPLPIEMLRAITSGPDGAPRPLPAREPS